MPSLSSAFVDGVNRVTRAPWLIIGLWVSTILLTLPLAITLQGMLAQHLGQSLAAEAAAAGANYDWWNEFLAQAAGVGQSFVPAIIGFAAVLKNLSGVADATRLSIVIMAAVSAHTVLSMFLLGGVMDRLARDRAIGTAAFFAACGVYFVRFIRLAVMAATIYWLLFTKLHPWLFDSVFSQLTRDLTVERTAFMYRALLYALFFAVVVAVNLVFDYAKVRAVVEDRRSMIGALVAGTRFVVRNAGAAIGLYALNALVFLAVIGLYALAAPGAAASASGFAIGQFYIVLRVAVRLQFAASQIALFQSRLAHAGYVARPTPAWPDSPAAEAIGPLL
ncbi:MAG: hypothetical protein ACRD2N_08925 [Vicinamibacterales bacterium]